MPTYTVEKVDPETREWKHPAGGDNVDYKINISGGDAFAGEMVTITRKPDSAPPAVGEVLEDYELKDSKGNFPRKLKRISGSGNTAASGASKASGNDYRTPQQIMRSDAHGKAMHWCDIKVAAGEWKPITWEQYIAMVDRYYDDIKSAA